MHDCLWGIVQRAAKHFLFVSSALFSAYFITICDNESFPKRKKSQQPDRLGSSLNVVKTHTCFQNAAKVFQKPHCLKGASPRTTSKIASVQFIAADNAAGKSSRL